MIDSSAENFKMRFCDFRSRVTNARIVRNPFSIEASDAPEELQLELIELQYDPVLSAVSTRLR
jgi:hypothetical protein